MVEAVEAEALANPDTGGAPAIGRRDDIAEVPGVRRDAVALSRLRRRPASSRHVIASEFGVARFINVDLQPHFNIAPSQLIGAVIEDKGERRMGPMVWGFATSSGKTAPINARAETVATMPLFREAFRRRRCLIIADGFYEWRRDGARKTPFFFHLRAGRPFAFAGLWSSARSDAGARTASCAILTCEPNELVASVHDRMPVILPAGARDRWLDRETTESDLRDILRPLLASEMDVYEVSAAVNSPKNDSPECLQPVAAG